MFVEVTVNVTIDPVEEHDICEKYHMSPEWRCVHKSDTCHIFEMGSGIVKCEEPHFIEKPYLTDIGKGGDDG